MEYRRTFLVLGDTPWNAVVQGSWKNQGWFFQQRWRSYGDLSKIRAQWCPDRGA